MKLFIDTSDREKIVIGLDGEKVETDARTEKSQKLLRFIFEELAKRDATVEDLTEIEVVRGPGSFTGLRVGISVANAIGWAKNIPVNSQNIAQEGSITPVYS